MQVADLQLTAKVRVILAPLVGKIPGFGAISVSILGYPFLDFSLVALSVRALSLEAPEQSRRKHALGPQAAGSAPSHAALPEGVGSGGGGGGLAADSSAHGLSSLRC